jgi:hypothetical protein
MKKWMIEIHEVTVHKVYLTTDDEQYPVDAECLAMHALDGGWPFEDPRPEYVLNEIVVSESYYDEASQVDEIEVEEGKPDDDAEVL